MTDKKVKFGVTIPSISGKGSFKADTTTTVAKVGEESGWDSLWCPDHLLHLSGMEVPEAWTLLTAAATVTNKVELGTCVTDPHRHHPALLAQRLATIDQLSKGRVILGLGAGCAVNMDTFNIKWSNPVSKMEEYSKIMKGLWSGEKISHVGKHWSFEDAFLQITPRRESIPIYFAANSPRTLRLTGQYADGWIPTALTPEIYRKRLRVIREAAEEAGRGADAIDAGLYVAICLTDTTERAKSMMGFWKTLLSPSNLLEAGYDIGFPEKLKTYSYVGWEPTPEYMSMLNEYCSYVPDEALNDFFIIGTAGDCRRKVEEFIDAGVKHFIMEPEAESHVGIVEEFGRRIVSNYK